ncbi:MAG: HD family hydrolase [Cohaesibacter sp.]|nr:HD family hydrolase [Cohaesibacter sp.]
MPSPSSQGRAWQRMLSGRRLDLLDPSPFDVEIEDIAHGLARVARWNGQTVGAHPFSVAQHSLIVEQILSHTDPHLGEPALLMALLHDAPEYVIGDMISPFKAAIGTDYRLVEDRLEAAIHLRFGLAPHPSPALKKQIKQADKISAYFEAVHLAGFEHGEAADLFGRPDGITAEQLPLVPWSTQEAEEAFLARFSALYRPAS